MSRTRAREASRQRRAISDSFHRLKFNRQIFDQWLHNLLVIMIAELDGIGMRPSFKNDILFLSQTLVHIGWQTIEIAKWRHRSNRAIREQRLEFLFGVERRRSAGCLLDLVKIDAV